ncbi:hypothetical protein Taro_002234, partial [Colocasia esculenta]|nr:hypothetical protein [Colocasia esculenta]
YPRKDKTQRVEGLTTRPPQSTTPPQHLKRLVHNVPRETDTHKGYRYLPPRGTTTGQTTTNESLYTSYDHWQSTSRKERCHHTRTDYWFMTPVSNSDNTTQELPLSLTVTDERSNCRSTSTSQRTVETNQHHTYRPYSCRSMPCTFRDSGQSSLK